MRFALVKSDDAAVVFDEVIIDSQSGYCDLTLVTLRGQYRADGGATYFKVRIENMVSDPAQWQVTTQQAWGGTENTTDFPNYPLELGLANQTFVGTADGATSRNRYPWSVNALGVMAQSRLRIPAKPQRYGWEQRSLINTESGDLRDGEVYYDTSQVAVLMVMDDDEMFVALQPERVTSTASTVDWNVGDAKNIVVTSSSGQALIRIETDASKVPNGTKLRIYDKTTSLGSTGVKWGAGGSGANFVISRNCATELVFVGGKWRTTFHNIAYVLQP